MSIRVELDGQLLSDFMKIKAERNFELNTEAIRYCITETAREANFSLEDEHVKLIQNFIDRKHIRNKYSIFSVQDFIRKAIDNFTQEIKNRNESLRSFDVRMNLNKQENEIALAIIELQSQKPTEMITLEDLVEFLGHKNRDFLRSKLDDFVNRSLLTKSIMENEVYYHARK